MNFYALIPLTTFLINTFLIVFIKASKGWTPITRDYIFLALPLSFWALQDYFMWSIVRTVSHDFVMLVLLWTPILWVPIGFLFVNFSYSFIKKPKKGIFYWLCILGVVVALAVDFFTKYLSKDYELTKWGFIHISGPAYMPIIFMTMLLPVLYMSFIFIKEMRRSDDKLYREQLRLLLWGVGLTLFFGVMSNVVLPEILNIRDVVQLGSSSVLILSIYVYMAINRYDFLSISVEDVARDLFDSIQDGVILLDHEDVVVHVNLAANRFFNIFYKTRVEIAITDFIPDYKLYEQSKDFEINICENNEDRFYSISQSQISRKDVTTGKLLIFRDITEHKRMEAGLRGAKSAAEAANRAKTQFLANISHEVRTPLNSIIGFADLLNEMASNKKQKEYLDFIIKESNVLLRLLNEILDLAKCEAGKLIIENLPFDLMILLKNIKQSFELLAAKKSLALLISIEPDVPTRIIGDPNRIRQVLVNLIDNAIKFTDEGFIDVKVSSQGEVDNKIILYFEVKDTGIGIPQEKQGLIFESFTQADGSMTRKYGGTGLGTTISKELIELMGGEIGVRSEVGAGSTFWFTLPFNEQGDQVAGVTLAPDEVVSIDDRIRNKRILLVDDYQSNQVLIQTHLAKTGCLLEIANNGQEAYRKSMADKYDLILMDIGMPEMDGFEATYYIRQGNGLSSNTPIVAMTAHTFEDDKKKCMDSGMDDILPKPISKKSLYAILAKWLIETRSATRDKDALHLDTSRKISTKDMIKNLKDEIHDLVNFLNPLPSQLEIIKIEYPDKNLAKYLEEVKVALNKSFDLIEQMKAEIRSTK